MLHIISNPHSGRGNLRTASLVRRLRSENIPFVMHRTDTPEEQTEFLRTFRPGKNDHLLLIGGDGSLHTLINQIPPEKLPVLCLLPSGSGNDFARGIHMKKGQDALLSLLKDPRILRPAYLDCGEADLPARSGNTVCDSRQNREVSAAQRSVQSTGKNIPDGAGQSKNNRRFLISCGIGYDAGVCDAINRSPVKAAANRLHMGRALYFFLGLRHVMHYDPFELRLRTDGGKVRTFPGTAFLSCHNTAYEGGGFPFAPGASARNGYLDLCVITGRNRAEFFLGIAAAFFGGHHGHLPNVHLIRCREAEVLSDRPLPFHADGEVISGVRGFRVRCLPSCVPFLYVSGTD